MPDENSVDDMLTVDNNDTSSAATAVSETPAQEASASPAQESQTSESTDATSTGEAGNDAPPDAGADGSNPSLTPPTPSKSPVHDWQKRHKDLEREFQRRTQQLKQYQNQLRQYEGIDPGAIRQWQEQQAHAQRASLPQWDPSHPENSKFTALQERWSFGNKFLTAHQQHPAFEDMRNNMLAQFSPQERQQMQSWSQHQQAEIARFASNPAAHQEMIRKEAAQVFQGEFQRLQQESQERAQAESHVDGWFKNPANKAVIANYGQAMFQALQQGQPWHIVQRDAEIAHYRAQLGKGNQTVAAAEEQRRLAKGNATITRDPATSPKADLYQEAVKLAKERGIQPGTPSFMPIIHEVETRFASA